MNWWHKNPLEADAWFREAFPKDHKYLHDVKNEKLKIHGRRFKRND